MFTGKYELVVVYADGERALYEYDTIEKAERAEQNIRIACGTQVAWAGFRRQIAK